MFGLTHGATEQRAETLEELAKASNAIDASAGLPVSFWAEEQGGKRELTAEETEELANLQIYYAELDACDPTAA